MSKDEAVVNIDSLTQSFLSKRSKGTQVMAGSMKMLGDFSVKGNTLNAKNVFSDSLNASGTISATLFSGSGASLTNLNSTNLTGTINDARLASNVMRTDKKQTVTSDMTISNGSTLYFAGGTSYWISKDGTARLNRQYLPKT